MRFTSAVNNGKTHFALMFLLILLRLLLLSMVLSVLESPLCQFILVSPMQSHRSRSTFSVTWANVIYLYRYTHTHTSVSPTEHILLESEIQSGLGLFRASIIEREEANNARAPPHTISCTFSRPLFAHYLDDLDAASSCT